MPSLDPQQDPIWDQNETYEAQVGSTKNPAEAGLMKSRPERCDPTSGDHVVVCMPWIRKSK